MMRNIFHPPPRLYAEAVGTNPPYGYKIKFIAFRGRPFIRAPTASLLPVGGTNTLIFFSLFFMRVFDALKRASPFLPPSGWSALAVGRHEKVERAI